MKAWMRQIPISNKIYGTSKDRRSRSSGVEVMKAIAVYTHRRVITICPALIFAARRKDRVAGRAEILLDSIATRNGFSQRGAPPGRSMARNFIGLFIKDDIIRLVQPVRPNVRVNKRWLVNLNV